ncbi:MAG: hypothetical protein FWH20_00570 [Oscillospiraceae bacterium]|nr:hypothetical protein [Oscillospiraceae bacterium]
MQLYRMQGDVLQLHRYKLTYTENEISFASGKKPVEKAVQKHEYLISDEHRDEFIQLLENRGISEYEIESLEQYQLDNEWLNGKTFEDITQVAVAFEMGEAAFLLHLQENDTELQTALYLTELDFRLILLEWGFAV